MPWIASLESSIDEALARYPDNVQLASLVMENQPYLVSFEALQEMARMQLGQLPLSTVAMPAHLTEILTRPHQEKLVKDASHHLCDYFPNFFVAAVYELQSLFTAHGHKAYIIGGITRGMLLSGERRFDIRDVDITVEGNAVDAAQFITQNSKNFDLVQEYIPFGTAKVNYKDKIQIDFASTRQETYDHCGALPKIVALGVPLEVDMTRRDFTINALALSILKPGKLIDCTGGLTDLDNRLMRLLKVTSFFEDPTRILRALSFAVRLDFDWAEDTHLILSKFTPCMAGIYKGGGERIRDELNKLFNQRESATKRKWLQYFAQKGLHRLIDSRLPETMHWPLSLEQTADKITTLCRALEEFANEDWPPLIYLMLLLMAFPLPLVELAMQRLGMTRQEVEIFQKSQIVIHDGTFNGLTAKDSASRLYDAFHGLPPVSVCVGMMMVSDFKSCLEAYLRYRNELEPVQLEVTGDDILKLGVAPGEQVGRMLRDLKHAKLEGQVHHRPEELEWLKTHIDKQPESSAL